MLDRQFPFFIVKRILPIVQSWQCFFCALTEMQKENKGAETFLLRKKPLTP